jgi:hypothetical protein
LLLEELGVSELLESAESCRLKIAAIKLLDLGRDLRRNLNTGGGDSVHGYPVKLVERIYWTDI